MTHYNSPAACMQKCSYYNFKYAGVQYNYQCWCGNEYNSYGVATNCNMNCPNSKVNTCGGAWANDIYEMIPNNSSFGMPGHQVIAYQNKTVCQGQSFNFTCSAGQIISIRYAMYGRISRAKCQGQGNYNYDKCDMIEPPNDLIDQCNGKNNCYFTVSNKNLIKNGNDPCSIYSKYLDIIYGCTSMYHL